MKYAERKTLMEQLNPEQLNGGKAPAQLAEGYFRWYLITLLGDIADQLGTTAYAYQEMLKIQQSKSGAGPRPGSSAPPAAAAAPAIPPTTDSRYGNRGGAK